jgi:hypothetical protein
MQKQNPEIERRGKNEEVISRNCLPHHKKASIFSNMHKATGLHLLHTLSRYCRMSESVQCDEQCSSLHAEMLKKLNPHMYFN